MTVLENADRASSAAAPDAGGAVPAGGPYAADPVLVVMGVSGSGK